ncbi:unnamed protein product [Mytilus edulis]|uniref:G-protein coupled receptors family 1 profile domain-containing protein n=1 Tax=Mytilus edulis TaxID=6550 RepID=A0A8S3R1J8_MYTED|nr:unnamed protein product [Mytilus edulis]
MSLLEDSILNMSVAMNVSVDTDTNYYVIQKDIVIMIKKICYFGIIPILIVSGLILNALCCVMFYKLKSKTSTVVILVALAATDIFILLTAIVYVIKIVSIYVGVPLTANQMIQMLPYFDNFIASVPNRIGNILTFMLSAERLLCVLKPMTVKHYFTRKTAVISVVMTYALTLIVSLPQGFYFRAVKMYSNDTGTIMMVYVIKPTRLGQFVDFTDSYNIVLTCVFTFVPVFGVMLMSTLTGIVVIISGRRRFQITEGMTKAITSKEMHVTKTLLTITFTFTICQLPGAIGMMIIFIEMKPYKYTSNVFEVVMAISYIPFLLNSTVNFIIYYKTSRTYRDKIKSIFICYGKCRERHHKRDT